MIWESASEFWAMGGYGLYVWGSYGVALACMAVEPWRALQRRRAALRHAALTASARLHEEEEA
jgi:heme exporter protein D